MTRSPATMCSASKRAHGPSVDRRRRGAAMIEAVLVLPFLLFIFVLVLYFGSAMKRAQRVVMLDRYEAWRSTAYAPGPTADSSSRMNAAFFDGDPASQLDLERSGYFPPEPADEWQYLAGTYSADAAALAESYADHMPYGRTVRGTASHDEAIDALESIHGPISHRHVRLRGEWRFMSHPLREDRTGWYDDVNGQEWPLLQVEGRVEQPPRLGPAHAVRLAMFTDFDARLEPIRATNPIAQSIFGFYTYYPHYRGSYLGSQWDRETQSWY